jgi:RNA polymerase sigma-70 factor, ECF subfamily
VKSLDSITSNNGTFRESDADLVRKALGGDSDAFARLFHAHKGRIYAICLRMTNSAADADDLTQEAFIQAFRKLATFRGDATLSTWLHRVAVNTVLMHFRRHGARATSLNETEPETHRRELGEQDERLKHSLDRIALTRALAALPFGYRQVFELHEIGGYGHREIARLLRCSVGNSKSQLHKAKERMRECLASRRRLAGYLQRKSTAEAAARKKAWSARVTDTVQSRRQRHAEYECSFPNSHLPPLAQTTGWMER